VLLSAGSRVRAILTYHSIDDSGSPVSVSPAAFRAHCRFLGSGRVRVLPLESLLSDAEADDAVALTFDDGFRNVLDVAAPLLAEHGLSATIFAVSRHVGRNNDWGGKRQAGIPQLPLMTWDELATLRAAGHTIGAHTRSHPSLPGCSNDQLHDELAGCQEDLATHLGSRPDCFAYPYGAIDDRTAAAVRQVYRLACSTELRPLSAGDDAAALPRIDMYYLRTLDALDRWGSVTFRSHLWMRAAGRRLRGIAARGAA
jgi:peptidoglycan/xylan/chitin deacetylase (PgdA/CDA1 family)